MAEIGETPLTMIMRRNGLLPALTRREIRWRWIKAWFNGYHYRMIKYGHLLRWWDSWWKPEYSREVWLRRLVTGQTGSLISFRGKMIAFKPHLDGPNGPKRRRRW